MKEYLEWCLSSCEVKRNFHRHNKTYGLRNKTEQISINAASAESLCGVGTRGAGWAWRMGNKCTLTHRETIVVQDEKKEICENSAGDTQTEDRRKKN